MVGVGKKGGVWVLLCLTCRFFSGSWVAGLGGVGKGCVRGDLGEGGTQMMVMVKKKKKERHRHRHIEQVQVVVNNTLLRRVFIMRYVRVIIVILSKGKVGSWFPPPPHPPSPFPPFSPTNILSHLFTPPKPQLSHPSTP